MLRRWSSGRFVSIAHHLKQIHLLERRYISHTRVLRNTPEVVKQAGNAPLRKQLKDAARATKKQGSNAKSEVELKHLQRLAEWELTVGIEIHAQLNTASKLFSRKFKVFSRLESN